MPIYEYRCQSCAEEFEDLVRMSTPDEEIECPKCGRHQSKRMLSVFSGRSATGATASRAAGSAGTGSGFS